MSSVLDDRPMYEWILDARILPMGDDGNGDGGDGLAQTAALKTPQFVFGRGFGRQLHPDEGLLLAENGAATSPETKQRDTESAKFGVEASGVPLKLTRGLKRPRSPALPMDNGTASTTEEGQGSTGATMAAVPRNPTKRQARIAWADDEEL